MRHKILANVITMMGTHKSVFGLLWIYFHLSLVHGDNPDTRHHDNSLEPSFLMPIDNITVPVGRDATLNCVVQNLGNYKVGWMRLSDQTVLALQGRVVTHNSRYSVAQEQSNIWRLKIKNIRESDKGCYMCQINTTPLKKQVGCMDIHVPPDISDDDSSNDITVREGKNVTLYCNANGNPTPRITWRRDDGTSIIIQANQTAMRKVDSIVGNFLHLLSVEKRQMGAYLCMASNGVAPAVSKRVYLNIHFPPNVTTSRSLFGAFENADVEVECIIEASPRSVNYWMKGSYLKRTSDVPHKLDMLYESKKHTITETNLSLYKWKMTLKIKRFNELDVGTYSCISTNSLGRANKTIRIYEVKIPTTATTIATTTPTTTTTTTRTSTTIVPPFTTKMKRIITSIKSTAGADVALMAAAAASPPPITTPSLPGQYLATDNVVEYITYTPGLLDHYSGETYMNQPRLNVVYSNAAKLLPINFICCVIIFIDLAVLR